ncbi:MAG: hypothetical protein IK015_06655 [Treponema sp.]|nr:hypothetical protein [Treponema sp.]
MIYLRKRQDDQPVYEDFTSDQYLKQDMISFDEYYQSINSSILDQNLESNILWTLFQLVDICLRCIIVYNYLIIPTNKKKNEFFKCFANSVKLSKYVCLTNIIPLEQINKIPKKVKKIFFLNYNEAMLDFSKENIECIKQYKRNSFKLIKPSHLRTELALYEKSTVSDILHSGLWSNIRVLPIENRGLNKPHNRKEPIIDFLSDNLLEINDKEQPIKQITDTSEYLKQHAIMAFKDYLKLASCYFDKLSNNEYLEKRCFIFDQQECEEKKHFLSLLQDHNFIAIKNNCSRFEDYCYILIRAKVLKYENNTLQATKKDSWGAYYPGSFIHDKELDLRVHIPQINIYFMSLFNLKTKNDLKDKEPSTYTYTGYPALSEKTIIPKLNELDLLRKARKI